jgi:hypothetical protein
MGFMDEIAGSGAARLLKFDGRVGHYVARGSDADLGGQEFVASVCAARGGYIKFNGKGTPPERRFGPLFPKDEAPLRSTLGDLDRSTWPAAKFGGDDVEDPWIQCVEVPLRHKESGEEYVFTAQSKTSLAAAKDFLAQCRRLPEGYEPIVKLCVGSFKGKFGVVKKPLLSVVGKVAEAGDAPDDEIPF